MVTWRELVDEAASDLGRSEVPDPGLSAVRIGQEATGSEGAEWQDTLDRPATRRQVAAFDAMVARRRTGEPLQYVVGRWGFRRLDLFVDRRVLIPRPETEAIAGAALGELEQTRSDEDGATPVIVVDLGTGSGAIGLSIADENPDVDVWLTDASSDALAVARANIVGLGRAGARVRAVEGEWFDALPDRLGGRISVIVSNPPYVGGGDQVDPQVGWEPPAALYAADSARGVPAGSHLEHLVEGAGLWLTASGALVLEMAPHQVDAMVDQAKERFVEVDTVVDLSGRRRGIVARHPIRPPNS